MKVVLALVTVLGCASTANAWSAAPNHSGRVSKTAQQAIAIPLEQPPIVEQAEDYDDTAWVANLDYEGFHKEVNDLGKQLLKETGEQDVEHLEKILRWRDMAALLGIATMWATPNPLTVAALSTWTYASWTMVAHHTCHGGYNRVDAGKYNSRGFALGTVVRRIQDWCDWMAPEAWNVEHNRLHHYHLGEVKDPDLVQRNLQFLRDSERPTYLKYATVALLMPIWKWSYYAPNTYKELQIQKYKKEVGELPKDMKPMESLTVGNLISPQTDAERAAREVVKPADFFLNVLGPFFFSRFILLPAPLLAIPGVGPTLFGHAIVNLVLADLLTNIHGFVTIVTNHAGEDVYTFDDAVKPKTGSFYVRQIVGSANYKTGTDPIDFAHGWLNYQIGKLLHDSEHIDTGNH
jgi:hypothetical protein